MYAVYKGMYILFAGELSSSNNIFECSVFVERLLARVFWWNPDGACL